LTTLAGMTQARPRGRTEVVEAVLDSAQTLIAEKGPAVGLREIAEHAGVNFGLIYQYVGTKEQLVGEVYARAARNAAERLVAAEHLDDALALLMTFCDGATARLVGWAALEGVQSDDLFRDSPALDVLAGFALADAEEAGRDLSMEDARVFAALAMVISLGWRLFGRTALAAAGLDGTNPESYDTRIRAHLTDLAAGATQRPPAPVTTG
jgi:TetR/AcrR family transcriptional regulator, repressor for neighboring sulfatase